METVYRDYAPKGVKFYYIYKALAHPETNGYVKPVTLQERLMHIREAKAKLGSQVPWLCDSMDNTVLHAMGHAPNAEFIIDPEGKVVVRRVWSRPQELREDLAKFVGAVEHPTRVEDLNIKPYSRRLDPGVAKVKPVKVPPNVRPLQLKAGLSSEPFYAKLRAEAEPSVIRGDGEGQIYLEFRLDPLYQVHWNNLAGPLEFEIQNATGITITPAKGTGPKLDVETDAAPREFLVTATTTDASREARSFDVVVRFFACHDTEGWCKPFTETFHVTVAADQDGGWVMGRRPSGPVAAQGRRSVRGPRLMGEVIEVDRDKKLVSLRMRGGGRKVFAWTDATMVMQRGAGPASRPERSSFEKVKPGMRVMLMVQPGEPAADGTPPQIVRMMVMPGRPR